MQELSVKLVFIVSPEQRLVFADEAVLQMRAHAQRSRWQAEAGGVLLGRHLLDSKDMAVDEVTVPQKEDRRSRFNFFRSKQHSALARVRWDVSRGTSAYLGLWHTHPERDPSPSSVDRRDWERAVSLDTFEGDRLFFPIVGIDRIRVWTKTRIGPIEQLRAERSDDD
jgi:integrative and conjugative element protein (TIGR02256 family)